MVMVHAEVAEVNGVIVVLDQEKAYDKITHDYLWKTLEAYKLPERFINTVKSLYSDTSTRVMINGHLSTPFQVRCGVRQGDPLSCLLFDIAIEPLAEALRKSNLKGLKIPGTTKRLIANLFADDTTTFLSEEDNFDELEEILKKWCIASHAHFNISKTKILPVGTKTFQEKVIKERRLTPTDREFPEEIHIIKENEAIQILSAWFGNEINNSEVWAGTLEKKKN